MPDVTPPIFPEQATALLSDIFGVIEKWKEYNAKINNIEVPTFLSAFKSAMYKQNPDDSVYAVLNDTWGGKYGQALEQYGGNPLSNLTDVWTSSYSEIINQTIRSKWFEVMGVVSLTRDELVWARTMDLIGEEQYLTALKHQGVAPHDNNTLRRVAHLQPNLVNAHSLMLRYGDKTKSNRFFDMNDLKTTYAFDLFGETNCSILSIPDYMRWGFLSGIDEDKMRTYLNGIDVVNSEINGWIEATSAGMDLSYVVQLGESGAITDTEYKSYYLANGGRESTWEYWRNTYAKRFDIRDWMSSSHALDGDLFGDDNSASWLRALGYTWDDWERLQYLSLQKISAYESLQAHRIITHATAGEIPPITDAEKDILQFCGVHPSHYDFARVNTMYYPPVSDLITMAVREVFSPSIANKFGLFDDLPPEFVSRAKQQGMNEYWAKNYWGMHWRLPSPTEGFEMLHRGIITQDELEMLLRADDYMPFWRKKLIQLNYKPYTRVDVRRMFALGVLDKKEVVKAYKELGYNDEKAIKMSDYVEKQTIAASSTITASDVVSDYIEKLITQKQAHDLLAGLNIPNDIIAKTLKSAEFKRDTTYYKQVIVETRNLYHNKKDINGRFTVSDNEARSILQTRGITLEKSTELVNIWSIQRLNV